MRFKISPTLFSFFLFLLFGYSCTKKQTAEQVINNYYEAIGSYDSLKAIKSIHSVIAHREKGLDLTIILEIYGRRPDLRRVNWSIESINAGGAEGYDGSRPWEINQETGLAEVLTGAKGAAARRGAEFDESFVDAKRKGHKVTYEGMETLFGNEMHRIRVVLDDGWIKDYYFNPETRLIAALRKTMPVHGEGEAVPSITRYKDYRKVASVLFPYTFEEYHAETGEWMSSNEVMELEANIAFPDSLIQPPNPL